LLFTKVFTEFALQVWPVLQTSCATLALLEKGPSNSILDKNALCFEDMGGALAFEHSLKQFCGQNLFLAPARHLSKGKVAESYRGSRRL
jgi:hypothetical protein